MPLQVIGISHKTAAIELRSKLSFTDADLANALLDIKAMQITNGAIILSTCNRTEIYFDANDSFSVKTWWLNYKKQDKATFIDNIYEYTGIEAFEHAMKVACSLDSMVLGEPQILGQMKQAVATAKLTDTCNKKLDRCFQNVFATAKQVRHQTLIGHCPVSVAFFAVNTAKQHFKSLAELNILLIGAGSTAQLIGKHLKDCGAKNINIANRSLTNAEKLAQQLSAKAFEISKLDNLITTADLIITATGADTYLVCYNKIKEVMTKRIDTLFLVDISGTCNIDPQIRTITNTNLYNIDDIQDSIQKNTIIRSQAAIKAHDIIACNIKRLYPNKTTELADKTVVNYRDKAKNTANNELQRSLQLLESGKDAKDILAELSHRLTQKLLHTTSVNLTQAGINQQKDMLSLAQKLFE